MTVSVQNGFLLLHRACNAYYYYYARDENVYMHIVEKEEICREMMKKIESLSLVPVFAIFSWRETKTRTNIAINMQ